MKKRLLLAAGTVPAVLSAAAAALGFMISNRVMYIKKKDDEFILQREVDAKRLDENWYAAVPKSEKWIESANDYKIKAVFLEPVNTNRYVILSHGVTESKIASIKFARMLERLGFNSVIYDQRRHGESGGKTTSLGHYEKFDLEAVVEALKEHAGKDVRFGIHGESMGAATLLLYAGSVQDTADFYIADCAFSDVSEQLFHVIRTTTPLHSRLSVRLGSLFLKFRDGYTLDTISPREAVQAIEKPVLFIHTAQDTFVPPAMAEELYRLKPGDNKELKIFASGKHAQAFNDNPAEYEQVVLQFLQKYQLRTQKALQ